jgi:hypothetical protein
VTISQLEKLLSEVEGATESILATAQTTLPLLMNVSDFLQQHLSKIMLDPELLVDPEGFQHSISRLSATLNALSPLFQEKVKQTSSCLLVLSRLIQTVQEEVLLLEDIFRIISGPAFELKMMKADKKHPNQALIDKLLC